MNYRDWLQQVIYKIINPVVHGMIRIGITPNFITTTGLVLNIVAAALFVYAGVYKSGELAYVGWGGSIILNAWGTFALTEWLTGMTWVNGLLGYYIDNVFILSKIIVAVLVAFFWNYHLQRFFVYRNHNIKGFLKHYLENKKDEYEL